MSDRPVLVSRRRALAASAAVIPLLGAVTSCRSSSLFAGPDPLGNPPPLARDTVTLADAITAEHELIALYQRILLNEPSSSARARLLAPCLAHHVEHLTRLTGRLVVPAGAATPGRSPAAGTARLETPTLADLRDAEQQSSAAMLTRLASVPPDLAQLFASIAACDTIHALTLAGATP